MSPLFCFILLFLLGFSNANEEPDNILLVGGNLLNEYKRPILQYFHPNFVEIDRIFNQSVFNSNIVIVGNQLDHFSLFKESKLVQFYQIESNASAVVFTLRGLDELNLEEIQVLHQLIYQTNGGLVTIEIGPSVIQTKSLLDYSAFCWSSGRLNSQLASDVQNRVFLCNGIRPSSVKFLDEETVVPLNRKIEPTVLPIVPEPRFWPVFVASAAEADSKKQRSNKHTVQPNARQTRVYGKKKSDSASDAEETTESLTESKLGCRYRYSCYEEIGIKTNKPTVKKARTAEKSTEKQTSNKVGSTEDKDIEVKIDDNPNYKVECKYRKSCYETGQLDMDAIHETKHDAPKETKKEEQGDTSDERSVKFQCKYRKSCIEQTLSGDEKPSSRERKTKKATNKEVESPPVKNDVEESPKIKEKPSKNTNTPKRRPIASKNEENQIEVDIDDNSNYKVQCKYRKSCYKTGQLDMDAIHEAKYEVPKEIEKEEKVDTSDERSVKFHCKYRKSCIEQTLSGDEKPSSRERKTKKDTEPEVHVPVVVEEIDEVNTDEGLVESSEQVETLEEEGEVEIPNVEEEVEIPNVEEEVETPSVEEEVETPNVEEEVDETPKPKSARKSKESSTEFRKKDPNRYVSKFKTVGKYEKLPKSDIIEENESEDGSVEEDIPVEVTDQNEVEGDVSAEISEPIEAEEPEPDQEQPEDSEIETTVIHRDVVDDTHTNKDDAAPAVSLQTKLACKYRKSCLRTGELPNLEEKRKNAQIRETLIVHEPSSSSNELDRVKCKYRHSCYAKHQNVQVAKQESLPTKLVDDRKPKTEQKSAGKSKETEEEEIKVNQTVVDLNSITTAQRLNCKYRTSCYGGIKQTPKHTSSTRIIPVPSQSLRHINSKCHQYYLSCREEMGLPPKEHAPKVNGRRLCRKKKPNEN